MGELYSILAAATWALGVILYKRLGESLAPLALNLLKNGIVLLAMIPTAVLAHGWDWSGFTPHLLTLTLLSGVLGIALADTLYLRALNQLGAGAMGLVGNLFSPSVILLAWLFLGERLSGLQGLGFVLVAAGVGLTHAPAIPTQTEPGTEPPAALTPRWRGLWMGIVAVVLNAVGIVLIKPALEQAPFFQVALLRLVAALLVLLALWPVLKRAMGVWPGWRGVPWRVLLPGALLGQYVAMLFWLAGYKHAEASVAAILNETASIFILIFAALFLREPLTARRLWGVALTFGGVGVMLLA